MLTYIYGKDAVTVVLDGKPHVVRKGERMNTIISGITKGDWDLVKDTVQSAAGLARNFAKFGKVEVVGSHVFLNGKELHGYLVRRIINARDRQEIIAPLCRFLENLQQNPDPRAQADLFEWVEHAGYGITADGCIIATRAITSDWKDIRTRTMDNSIGTVVRMPRERCDPNPDQTCSSGLHFATLSYLPNYSSAYEARYVIVRINPRDVVAFPRDYGWSKGRCCEFTVIEELPREEAEQYLRAGFVYRPPAPEARARSLGFRLMQDPMTGLWSWAHDTIPTPPPVFCIPTPVRVFETEKAAAIAAVAQWEASVVVDEDEIEDDQGIGQQPSKLKIRVQVPVGSPLY